MVSTVKSRPNYYEMLGLTPSAAGDAIAQAFARATSVFRPHEFGGITELCVAYETLRDPARRRAYDASLGLPPPKRDLPPVSRPASAHFMQWPAVAASPPLSLAESQSRPAPRVEQQPKPSVTPKSRPAPRIEQLLEQTASPPPHQSAYDDVSVGFSPIEWKRTGMVIGMLVAAAVFVGAVAGWWSSSSAAEPEQAAPSGRVLEEKAPPTFSELWSEPAPRAVETLADRPRRAVLPARPRIERAARRTQLTATEAERVLIQPPEDLAEPTESDPLAPAAAAAAPAVGAAMPLPHKTVARTIDRIGYRCGSVASATPIEGAAGNYKVICTSGQSFQAKPVNGRYRFRRLAGN